MTEQSREWTICTGCDEVVKRDDEGACLCDFRDWNKNRIEVVPASAPNVLSPEEARLLVKARDVASFVCLPTDLNLTAELCDRLAAYADMEETDD